jgi:hypothetical protein
VKLDKLVKQLKRDVAASPKKAATLALMLLAALYFWAPLVWKWAAPAGSTAAASQTAGLILTDEPPAVGEAEASGRLRLPWEKIRQVIHSDPHMTTAALDERWPDPFARRDVAAVAEAPASPVAGTGMAPEVAEPQAAGLVVTSIAISRRRRSATINGDTYEENDTIPAAGASPPFRVQRIERHAVTLERDGQTLVLELSRPGLAQGDEIQRLRANSGR